MAEDIYTITNVAMSAGTKIRRFNEPGRVRQKQFLAGRRILHNETMYLSAAEFEADAASILERVRIGAFQVTTPTGQLIFVDTHGNLKIRTGMTEEDYKPAQKPANTPPVKEVKKEIAQEVKQVAPPPPPVEVKPVPPPVEEPDFSAAYQAPPVERREEKKVEESHGKKGKRR